MSSTAQESHPLWQWPTESTVPSGDPDTGSSIPGAFHDDVANNTKTSTASPPPKQHGALPTQDTQWHPRTCRICLETVHPTFHLPSENIPGFLQPAINVTYESSDAEAGRLLRPCKCKGSSKYVHEGCLQAWRHADSDYGKRNYWQCPTCGFNYRLERMAWGRWISSTATQLVLTGTIFATALFVMGFVADPIINLYADPYSILSSPSALKSKIEPILTDDDVVTWTEHFIKGLASLGLLSFVKVLFVLSPWQWWNLRSSGIMSGSGRSANTGRDRIASISWIVVLIGIGTFLWAVYKGVRAWSRRTLEKAGEKVMDVAGDEDNDRKSSAD